jgi:hypothetical protein
MNIIEEVKTILFDFIKEKYHNYLNENRILLIKDENIDEVIEEFYKNNDKKIKSLVRETLKEKYNEKYPSATVENILLDIFQDSEFNIKKIADEIKLSQKINQKELDLPIINNSLNLNISIIENFVIINSTNNKKIETHDELYETINQYKFLYSINNTILHEIENSEKIKRIKSEIENKESIKICVYYLKTNEQDSNPISGNESTIENTCQE